MTRESFDRLEKDCTIEMDGKTYTVLSVDKHGRVQLQQISFFVDLIEYISITFDTYDKAADYREQLIEECDPDDDEELLSDLEFADIAEQTTGNEFWMHYKDIEATDITYKF